MKTSTLRIANTRRIKSHSMRKMHEEEDLACSIGVEIRENGCRELKVCIIAITFKHMLCI